MCSFYIQEHRQHRSCKERLHKTVIKQRMALQCELRYKQKIALKLSNVLKKEGKFLKKLWCCVSGRVDKVKLITVKNVKADVSSVSLSSKRITKANARNLNFGVVTKQ